MKVVGMITSVIDRAASKHDDTTKIKVFKYPFECGRDAGPQGRHPVLGSRWDWMVVAGSFYSAHTFRPPESHRMKSPKVFKNSEWEKIGHDSSGARSNTSQARCYYEGKFSRIFCFFSPKSLPLHKYLCSGKLFGEKKQKILENLPS